MIPQEVWVELENTMTKAKMIKGKTTIYKTNITYRTKDRVTQTPLLNGVNSGAPEGSAVHAPLVAPIVLHSLQTR